MPGEVSRSYEGPTDDISVLPDWAFRTLNPPLNGGKHYLAPKIVALMPPHIHYVEPFFGGGAILLAKRPEGVSEVANDLNRNLTNFWHNLQDATSFELMRRKLLATPFSQAEFERAYEIIKPHSDWPATPLDKAIAFFVFCRQSLAGRMQSFTPLTKKRVRRGMNAEASAWLSAIEGLPAVHERLKRVVILNRPALDVIRQQDGPQTLFYCDPPYLYETRSTMKEYGEFEMTELDHAELLSAINVLKGKVMISGYSSNLYEESLSNWTRHEFNLPNNAAGGKTKGREIECLWTNF